MVLINPVTYSRIIFIIWAQNSVVAAFSVADFLANGGKQVLVNAAAQYAGYMLANPENLNNLVPICANSKVALDFIQAANSMPIANERVATVALLYTTATAVIKTGTYRSMLVWVP